MRSVLLTVLVILASCKPRPKPVEPVESLENAKIWIDFYMGSDSGVKWWCSEPSHSICDDQINCIVQTGDHKWLILCDADHCEEVDDRKLYAEELE